MDTPLTPNATATTKSSFSVAHIAQIATETNIKITSVTATATLLSEGATLPFIARYRKEVTGDLDEVQIGTIRDRLQQLADMAARRDTILRTIEGQGKLSADLKNKIESAQTMASLEDLYLPYKPKRRTRGTMARERGLEPLAAILLAQDPQANPEELAAPYVDPAKEVADVTVALAGARDILAENMADTAEVRAKIREMYEKQAMLTSKVLHGQEEAGAKFRDYFEWQEPAMKAPSHRVLAIRRGAEEGVLSYSVQPDEDIAIQWLVDYAVKNDSPCGLEVRKAMRDTFKRLLSLSMETEMRLKLKKAADEEAIRVFTDNLRQLLLASPMGQKRVLALDPGYRTGCKIAVLDAQGKLLYDDKIYLHQEQAACATLRQLVERYEIESIAVGNGTASRETQQLAESIDYGRKVPAVMVSEAGASVYSASEIAREEFPDKDVTVRGAISIGRRLMDPLAELVKIDPKSIGVGQYQHDVDQRKLAASLQDTMVSCVSSVGVELNTASKPLLASVAGLNERLAGNVVSHRESNGPFKNRDALLKVAGMGPKTFQQAAGFLRVHGSAHPLDASAVHPERYELVEKMASDAGCNVSDLLQDESARKRIDLSRYVCDEVGLPTLRDIVNELAKPGRDPREPFQLFQFDENVKEMTDLHEGMKLPGVVTNVTNFGCFVDIGVHQDGLVHISQLADRFVSHPSEIVKVHQKVEVTVTEIDLPRKRIALSMRQNPDKASSRGPKGSSARTTPNSTSKPSRNNQRNSSRPANTGNNPFGDFFKNYDVK